MPLIVTGTIMFTPQQTSGFVPVNREVYDQLGRRSVIQQRVYQERKGFILEPKFVFIDGRTGATLHSETYRREILHATQQTVPALATYFELMDQLIPDFLGTEHPENPGYANPCFDRSGWPPPRGSCYPNTFAQSD